jgi:uncharacterized protein (TIGR01777 family)
MRILISGSSGLIGRAIVAELSQAGHEITRLVRGGPSADRPAIFWDPLGDFLDPLPLEGFDAVIHLAGENIAAARWTPQQKDKILKSRVQSTRLLANTLAGLRHKPRVLVCASAVGFYGDRGAEIVDESTPAGKGFLAQVAAAWEEAGRPAEAAGIRTVYLRLGAVLAAEGGMVPRLLPLFRWGLGAVLGPGTQFLSWVSLRDVVRAVRFLLERENLRGPVNITSPNPVTNREFSKALARAVGRPLLLRIPAWFLRLILGEMAQELFLASTRAVPRKLQSAGFDFEYPQIDQALCQVVRRV